LAKFSLASGLVLAVALLASGCGSAAPNGQGAGEASSTVGAKMAGPVVDVQVAPEAIADKPNPPVLTDPESAVRSYQDWISYAYRIAQSQIARPTMTSYEEVRVDSYVQFNIQKSRLIDQKLTSVTFSKPSIEASTAVVNSTEEWTYRYVSIEEPGKTISGPHTAKYKATYTLKKNDQGSWVVDSVKAEAQGPVK